MITLKAHKYECLEFLAHWIYFEHFLKRNFRNLLFTNVQSSFLFQI